MQPVLMWDTVNYTIVSALTTVFKILKKTNIRQVNPSDIPGAPFSFIVADLSFISLRKVLPSAWNSWHKQGKIVTLIKPQFECQKKRLMREKESFEMRRFTPEC